MSGPFHGDQGYYGYEESQEGQSDYESERRRQDMHF
jgi:hypothetical protein